jgi:glucose/mannose transport system substrate-binding protein
VIEPDRQRAEEFGRLGFERLVANFRDWLERAFDQPSDWRYRARDAATVNSPAFRKVLADFKRLKSYTDAGSPGRNWNDSTSLVITGKAGVQIMGD